MTDDTLSFASADQILLLFGAQDRYLRQVREAVGVGVTIRGDQLRLHGTEEQIRRGREVFSELKAILEERGVLQESEVRSVLGLAKTGGAGVTATRGAGGAAGPTERKPAESIDLNHGPFEILKRAAPWDRRDDGSPRRAAISAFGFGGINAHVLVEEIGRAHV